MIGNLFKYEIPPRFREQVLVALTTKRLVQRSWCDMESPDDNGCPFAIAVQVASGAQINQHQKHWLNIQQASEILGVKEDLVGQAIRAWDAFSREEVEAFLDEIRTELRLIQRPTQPTVRQLVDA